LFKRQGTSK